MEGMADADKAQRHTAGRNRQDTAHGGGGRPRPQASGARVCSWNGGILRKAFALRRPDAVAAARLPCGDAPGRGRKGTYGNGGEG